MSANRSDFEVQKWKSKYFTALGELEEKEKDWSGLEATLRHAVIRISLGITVSDKKLDPLLDELRREIRGGKDNRKLANLVERASALIVQLDDETSQAGSKSRAQFAQLLSLLEDKSLSKRTARGLAKLKSQVKAKSTPDQSILAGLIQLMPDVVAGLKATAESRDRPARSTAPATEPAETAVPEPEAEESKPDSASVDTELLFLRLRQVVDSVTLSTSMAAEKKALEQRLDSPSELEELPDLLALLADLVRGAALSEQQSFSDFASKLAHQLQSIEAFLRVVGENEEQSEQINERLGEDMEQRIEKMKQGVADAGDFGALRQAMGEELDAISERMENFQIEQSQRKSGFATKVEILDGELSEARDEISKLEGELETQKELASRDGLTGLANRQAFNECAAAELARCARHKSTMSLCMADIDHFKRVNDTFGHPAGDKVLKAVASIFRQSIRASDLAARFGGEEFILLFPESSSAQAAQVADKLRTAVSGCPFECRGEKVRITLSFGVAQLNAGESVDDLIARADESLYRAKNGGRNKVVCD